MKKIGLFLLFGLVFIPLLAGQTVYGAGKPAGAKKSPAAECAVDPNAYPAADEKELGQLRWVLKLADKPIDDFKDIHSLDQVGITASRYTLAFSVYFLAAEQYHKMPAWTEAIQPGMDRLIRKMLAKPVWEYWATDSKGVPKFEPLMDHPYQASEDPIAYRNIMYSGHLSQMVNLYQMLYNDRKWDKPGSIVLKWDDKKQFVYDNKSLQNAMFLQLITNPVPAVECEPNAVFPACNTHPLLAWKLFDKAHNTRYYAASTPLFLDWFKKNFVDAKTSEIGAFYLMKQGWVFSANNPRYGNKMDGAVQKMIKDGVNFGSSGNEGWIMTGIHVFDPQFVEKLYPAFKKLHVKEARDGSVTLEKDVLTPYSYYGFFSILAAEMGDEKLLRGLLKTVDAHFDPVWGEGGTFHYPYKVFAGGPNLAAADDANKAKTPAIKPPVKVPDAVPQMKTWPQHSDLSDRLFAMARALPKNGLLTMYNKPFDPAHFSQPAIIAVDLSKTPLKRAIYDREKKALVVSTMPAKSAGVGGFTIVRLDPAKTYTVAIDGKKTARFSGAAEYKVIFDAANAHDLILVQN